MKKVDIKSEKARLKEIVKDGYLQLAKKQDDMACFGLYTSSEGSMLAFAYQTNAHIEKMIKSDPDRKYYTYSTYEWIGEGYFDTPELSELNQEINDYIEFLLYGSEESPDYDEEAADAESLEFRTDLIEICVQVLEELKQEGLFPDELRLMVNIATGNFEIEEEDEIIIRLNGKDRLEG